MKKILFFITMILLIAVDGFSQAPGILNYQGVARNSVGNVLANKNISLRLTIRNNTAAGPTVYQESRAVTTNPFGLFNVQVGSPGASGVTGTIAGVPWGVGLKFIQVEIDPNGGSSFINIGTAQLASVPYTLYANLAGDLVLPFNKTQADAGTLFKITNSGTNSGSTALEGLTNSTAGSANAIIGTVTSAAPGGFSSGVRGINNGTGGFGIGVYGSQAGGGWGVYGTAPSGIGVNGNSTSGIGVNGFSTSGTGVFGSSSTGVAGIFINTNAANASDALQASTNGAGQAVSGINTGTGRGGYFQVNNAASTADALRAETNGTGASWAIRGISTGTNGAGLFQQTNPTNTANNLQSNQAGLGRAGLFQNTNAANTASTVQVNSNATSGVGLQVNQTGTGQVTGVFGNISTTTGASAAVLGADFSSGGASPVELRTYGVLGQTGTTGIAVGGYALTGGTALRGSGGGATGWALNTSGRVQLTGINEAPNRILTTVPGDGTATWQSPAVLGIVSGSGTLNFVPKWTPNGTNLGNSLIYDDGNRSQVGANVIAGSSFGINPTPGSPLPSLTFYKAATGEAFNIHETDDGSLHIEANSTTPGSGTKIMTFDDDNLNVGIGTTSPATKLHVVQTAATATRSEANYGAGGQGTFSRRAANIFSGANSNMGAIGFNNLASTPDRIPGWRAGVVGIDSSNDIFASGIAGFYKGETQGNGVYGFSSQNRSFESNASVTTVGFTGGQFHGGDAGVVAVIGGTGTSANKYGIYARATGGGTNWAGYFVGQVAILDGTQGAGKVLTSDAAGNASWQDFIIPAVHMSAASTTALVTVPPSTLTHITTQWGALNEAGGANYNPATGEYTIPVTGYYSVFLHLEWDGPAPSSGAGLIFGQITVNGSGVARGYSSTSIAGNIPAAAHAQIERNFNAGDIIRFSANQNTSGNMNLVVNTNACKFGIHLIHK